MTDLKRMVARMNDAERTTMTLEEIIQALAGCSSASDDAFHKYRYLSEPATTLKELSQIAERNEMAELQLELECEIAD